MITSKTASDDAANLDDHARRMIAQATSATSPNILSATGFARENISIVHQQRRVTNLAWALSRTGRVRAGDVVGIVGGTFSGLTLAVILALVNDAIVYIFEKEHRLLHRFRDKGHRYLSPVLNSRALGKRFDPIWSSPHFRAPVFDCPPAARATSPPTGCGISANSTGSCRSSPSPVMRFAPTSFIRATMASTSTSLSMFPTAP
jgi:hypothetical protein